MWRVGEAGKLLADLVILGLVLPLASTHLAAGSLRVSLDASSLLSGRGPASIRVENNGMLPVCVSGFEAGVSSGGSLIARIILDVEDACIMPGQSRYLRVEAVHFEEGNLAEAALGVATTGRIDYTVYAETPASFW